MCTSPLKGFIVGQLVNGKKDIVIKPYSADYIYRKKGTESWHEGRYPFSYVPGYEYCEKFINIPCGKCIDCRLEHSKQWAERCMLEAKQYQFNYFITCTYDDEHLPLAEWTNDHGSGKSPTLCKEDFQKFLKRLRKNLGIQFRYYMCGEYGSHTLRPHYHAIMFNFPINDLLFYKNTDTGFPLFNSETITQIWGKGHVVISPISWETCAYVARYTLKKAHNDMTEFFDSYNLVPEYVAMSRRPGIARNYYDKNYQDIYKFDGIVSVRTHQYIKPPRYFDKLLESTDPLLLESIKSKRDDVMQQANINASKTTSLIDYHRLQSKAVSQSSSIKSLKRKDI